MKYPTKSISRMLIFSLFMLINPLLLFAQPSVPGFIVEIYAQQNDLRPTQLSFDSTGVLYVGNNGAYVPIWQIGVGGSPINAYGDPIFDPDAVVIDETGDVTSLPGSVLVGSGEGGGNLAAIYEILTDETTNILFQTGNLINPQDMIIDHTGRLLIADAFRHAVLQSTGITPTVLFSQTLPNEVAVDTSGQIFTGSPSGIQIHDSNGNLIDDSFVTGIDIWGLDFGPGSPPWDGHLFAVSFQGKLYCIDEIGIVTEIGTGFNNPLDLKFGPDGAMYISDFGNNVIYRIVAEYDIEAAIKIHPRVFNLKSKGKRIISGIKLPEEYVPRDIARDSLELLILSCSDCEAIYPTCEFPMWKRYFAFFQRQDLIDEIKKANLDLPAELDIKVYGELDDGTPFEGLDTIRVIDQKRWRRRK